MEYGKKGSIIFLISTLLISLALSGIPFLVSKHQAKFNIDGLDINKNKS